jgi:excisionase family DNA binding protein
MSLREVAEYLRISVRSVEKLCRSRALKSAKVLRRRVVRLEDLTRYLDLQAALSA